MKADRRCPPVAPRHYANLRELVCIARPGDRRDARMLFKKRDAGAPARPRARAPVLGVAYTAPSVVCGSVEVTKGGQHDR